MVVQILSPEPKGYEDDGTGALSREMFQRLVLKLLNTSGERSLIHPISFELMHCLIDMQA